jgi:hypothetical protein
MWKNGPFSKEVSAVSNRACTLTPPIVHDFRRTCYELWMWYIIVRNRVGFPFG